VIGADGFGYAFGEGKYWKFPQAGIAEIGDDVEIGANTTIDRGSLDDTRIGEGVKLDNLVHVGHNCKIGAHTVVAAQAGLSGSCVFGKRVVVGGQAGFGERCKLEDGAVIGGRVECWAERRFAAGKCLGYAGAIFTEIQRIVCMVWTPPGVGRAHQRTRGKALAGNDKKSV